MKTPNQPTLWAACLIVAVAAAACSGSTEDARDPAGASNNDGVDNNDGTANNDTANNDTANNDDAPTPTAGATRRLSRVEVERSLTALTGVRPDALDLLPPDSLGHSYDRVVESQSFSRAHLDATFEVATEVADTLLGEARLDDVAGPACADDVLPPLVESRTQTASGATLGLGPEWAVEENPDDPESIITRYAPDPTASTSHEFPAPGRYRVALDLHVSSSLDRVEVDLGESPLVHVQEGVEGEATVAFEADVAQAGSQVITWRLSTEPDDHNLAVTYRQLRVEGPLDVGADAMAGARRACAEALVDDVAPQAWRRPLSGQERTRLLDLYGQAEGAAAFRMLIQAILASPHFLYLVEVGEPVEGEPGRRRLDSHEVAARLSFALCEQPPDEALRQAADADALTDPAEIEAQARRLLTLPCARRTLVRFYTHWLHLNHLVGLNKSPDAFPGFDDATRQGLVDESAAFVEAMVFEEDADLALFFTADYAWPDPRSAWLWGLDGADGERTALPPERRGVLTHPGTMAALAPFDDTSPVERGVFVNAQLLCAPLPPPPAELEVAPPPPDPSLTTRERWDQHSADPACAGCHSLIDPVGFAFEGFDGVGRYRTEDNGHPVDTTGGLLAIGIQDGELEGAVALSEAIAESDQLASCLATQWLRFTLGRLEQDADAPSTQAVAEVLEGQSMREGLVRFVTTESFLTRTEDP